MVNTTITQVSANREKNMIQIAYQKLSSTKQQQDSKGQQWSSGWKEIQLKWYAD